MFRPKPDYPFEHWDRVGRGPLDPGVRYRVVRSFTDYDGDRIEVGHEWIYRAYNFFPWEEGLSLLVEDDAGLLVFRLGMLVPENAEIWDKFGEYVVRVAVSSRQ